MICLARGAKCATLDAIGLFDSLSEPRANEPSCARIPASPRTPRPVPIRCKDSRREMLKCCDGSIVDQFLVQIHEFVAAQQHLRIQLPTSERGFFIGFATKVRQAESQFDVAS